MSTVFKHIAQTFVGALVAFVTIYIVEDIGHSVFPLPKNFDLENHYQMAIYIKNASTMALCFPILSYIFGSFLGGFVSNLISHKILIPIYVGAILILSTFFLILYIPHPLWFSIIALLIPIPTAITGGMTAKYFSIKRINEKASI